MRKTFVVGFIGLFLVGGFVSGLYLVNRPTNPSTSASEIVNPIRPPDVATEAPKSPSEFSLANCEKSYGLTKGDPKFNEVCDVDGNGLINVIDLQKMK